MIDPTDKKNADIFKFFSDKKSIIVDPTGTLQSAIFTMLKEFGTIEQNIAICKTIAEAREQISANKHHLVFTQLEIGEESGISLLDEHILARPNRLEAGFYILSSDNSICNACMVLDREIDAFISIPFSSQELQATFLKSIIHKINPSPYLKLVERGKEQIIQDKVDRAIKTLIDAKSKTENPAAAWYYEGVAYKKMDNLADAERCWQRCLEQNPIYYKALTSMAKIHYERDDFEEAYELNCRLLENYPVSPDKIPELTRLSIINKQYEDIISFCDIFTDVKELGTSVKKHISAGLAICGKYMFLNKKDKRRGAKILEESAQLAEGKIEILQNIYKTFVQAGQQAKGKKLIQKNGDQQVVSEILKD